MFSGWGFVHIIIDSMAMPDSMNLKGKTPVKSGEDITTDDYCGSYSSSEGSCSGFNKPYCYSTKFDNIVADSENYRRYVEGVYQIRKREIDYFVDTNAALLDAFSTIYAVGNSEGAMVLSRYYHANFTDRLAGVIIDGYSCEFNYYQSCAWNARVCGDQCAKTIPMLNLIGEDDEFFGRVSTSMAHRVAADPQGYGSASITGNCHKAFSDQKFIDSTTVVLGETAHTPKYWNDNLVRAVVEDFIGGKTKMWATDHNCTIIDGVYECPLLGAATCMPGWTFNENETKMCPRPGAFQDCLDVPTTEYTTFMPNQNVTVTVPPLPDGGSSYSYATDNALIAVPAMCAEEFAGDISKAADLANKNDCGPQGMKYFRIGDLTGGWSKVQEMAQCAGGLVFGAHGSGGPGWGQVQYAAMFSGWGFVHIIIDSMAMPDSMNLKGKTPVKSGEDITTDDYCGSYSSSEGSCSGFNKPYCYSTKFDNIVADSENYRRYVEGVYQIRKREIDYFVDTNAPLLDAFSTIYAVGNSEGAMVLSRYYHANF